MKRAVIFVEYENDKDLQDLLQTAKKTQKQKFLPSMKIWTQQIWNILRI